MPDSLTPFRIDRSPDGGVAYPWVPISGSPFSTSTRQTNDNTSYQSSPTREWQYRIVEITNNNVLVPYNTGILGESFSTLKWVHPLPPEVGSWAEVMDIAIDSNENIYGVGYNKIGPTQYDGFLIILDKNGTLKGGRRFSSTPEHSTTMVYCVAVRGSIVYLGGTFTGALDFGGVSRESGKDIANNPRADAFIVAYSIFGGDALWVKAFGSTGGSEQVYQMVVDSAGDIIATVHRDAGQSPFIIDGITLTEGSGTVILKIDGSTKICSWAKIVSGTLVTTGLTINSSGDIYNSFAFPNSSSVSVEGHPVSVYSGSKTWTTALTKFNSSGVYQWVKSLCNCDVIASGSGRYQIVTRADGTIWLSGTSAGTTIDGVTADPGIIQVGLNPDGTLLSKLVHGGSTNQDTGMGVALSVDQIRIAFCGASYIGTNLGGPSYFPGNGNANPFVCVFDLAANGTMTFRWGRKLGGSDAGLAGQCFVTPSGRVILCGFWTLGIDFGDGVSRSAPPPYYYAFIASYVL